VTRRSLLLLPAVAPAQNTRPRLNLIWTTNAIPTAFARQSVVFLRAYTSCPDAKQAGQALERGRFPHAFTAQDATLWNYFDRSTDPDALTVMTSASTNGADAPEDQAIHVPLAIRWPGRIQPRVVNDVLISHVDLLATLLALANQPKLASTQGRDLSTWLTRGSGSKPDAVFVEGRIGRRDEWRALVRGFDKLTWNLKNEITGLYNLADDPFEQKDLQRSRDHRVIRDNLWALAQQWMMRLQDRIDSHGLRTR
jgi:hypothetical protein